MITMLIEDLFKKAVCSSLEIEKTSLDTYLIHTGFTYSDGDEFHIMLKVSDDGWILTDEGHTTMWLSYEEYSFTPSRKDLIGRILGGSNVEFNKGELFVQFKPEDSGLALNSLTHSMMRIADLRYLSTDRVTNTFMEDLKGAFKRSRYNHICHYGRVIRLNNDEISPDVYIEATIPILIFGVTNANNCKDAIISILTLEKSSERYRYVSVMDSNEHIPKKDSNKLINLSDKSMFGLDDLDHLFERVISWDSVEI